MSQNTFELDDFDAAIVFRADGTLETSLPQVTDEEVPDNIMLSAAVALALQNEDLCELIRAHFYEVCQAPHDADNDMD